jgi:hypothetical protein
MATNGKRQEQVDYLGKLNSENEFSFLSVYTSESFPNYSVNCKIITLGDYEKIKLSATQKTCS